MIRAVVVCCKKNQRWVTGPQVCRSRFPIERLAASQCVSGLNFYGYYFMVIFNYCSNVLWHSLCMYVYSHIRLGKKKKPNFRHYLIWLPPIKICRLDLFYRLDEISYPTSPLAAYYFTSTTIDLTTMIEVLCIQRIASLSMYVIRPACRYSFWHVIARYNFPCFVADHQWCCSQSASRKATH